MIGGPHDVPEQSYRSDGGLNISALKNMRDCAAKAKWHLDNPKQPTPDMLAGTALHMAILEPERYERTYAPKPDIKATTKAGKAAVLEAKSGGKELLARLDYDGFREMAERIRGSAFYAKFLSNAVTEASWFYEHHSGRRLKARTDIWLPDLNLIVDVKSVNNLNALKFYRSAKDYGYDAQAAYYCDVVAGVTGQPVQGFIFLVVERGEDRGIRAFMAGPRLIDRGRKLYKNWLSQWLYCEATGVWPGHAEQLETLEIPAWELGDSDEF